MKSKLFILCLAWTLIIGVKTKVVENENSLSNDDNNKTPSSPKRNSLEQPSASRVDSSQESDVVQDTSSLLEDKPEVESQDILPERELDIARAQDLGYQEAEFAEMGGEGLDSLTGRSLGQTSTLNEDETELNESLASGEYLENTTGFHFQNFTRGEDHELGNLDGTGIVENRQFIGDPVHVNTAPLEHMRLPSPYPARLHIQMPSYHVVPKVVPIAHYKPVPFPVRYNKLQDVDSPYYMPFKTGPDVTETHVDVFQPISPCKTGGILIQSQGGLNCLCPRDFIGKYCDDKLYCASSPCENNGKCDEITDNYRCRCPKGFKGYNCEDHDECALSPCKNDGTCVETISGHKCICRHGFTGDVCQYLDYCDPNPCRHGGVCQQSSIQTSHHECQCLPHFKGSLCEDRRVCFANPCRNGGKCVEDGHHYPCICPAGYKPPYCREHVCASSPCMNGGKCVAQRSGFTWTHKCLCSLLYRGDECEIPNPCVTRPCLNGGTCVDSFSDYTGFPSNWNAAHLHYLCACPSGYSGPKCEDYICLQCDSNATCSAGRCICNQGYYGDGFRCHPHKNPCIPSPCENNGTCTVGPDGSFDCNCPPGYEPPLCIKKDVCVPNPCKHGGTCIGEVVHPGHLYAHEHFRCSCPAGFLSPDCSNTTKDPCEPNPCLNSGACSKSSTAAAGYICKCPPGIHFVPPLCACDCPKGDVSADPVILPAKCDATGDQCICPVIGTKQYELVEKGCAISSGTACASNPCKNNGTCENFQGSYRCKCPANCKGDQCQFCEVCTAGYCLNNGTCIAVGLKPYCRCPPGYKPPRCTKIDEPVIIKHYCHPNPCQNGGRCVERAGGYDCQCIAPYEGPHCEKDKCMECDIHAMCYNGNCKCRQGFRGSGYRGDCVKVERKCYMCPLNAMCVDGNCACVNGYHLQDHKCIKLL